MKKLAALLTALVLLALGTAAAQTTPATVTVTFVENPTTGYTWAVSNGDENVLAIEDAGYTAAANPGNLEGVGGSHRWVLTGKGEGDAAVTFVFGQAWDGGEVADTIVYTVHVAADLAVTVTGTTGNPDLYDPLKGAVLLNENPTTGYSWAYKASTEGILKLDWDKFVAPDTGADAMVGQGGYHMWVFSGLAEGETTLTFAYARSWEEGVTPDATVTYTFTVAKDLTVTLKEVGGDYSEYEPLPDTLGV